MKFMLFCRFGKRLSKILNRRSRFLGAWENPFGLCLPSSVRLDSSQRWRNSAVLGLAFIATIAYTYWLVLSRDRLLETLPLLLLTFPFDWRKQRVRWKCQVK